LHLFGPPRAPQEGGHGNDTRPDLASVRLDRLLPKRAGWEAGAAAYDVLPARRALRWRRQVCRFAPARNARWREADLVLSLRYRATRRSLPAKDYAALLRPGALWCDMNSVAPGTKRAAAKTVEAAGGRYVDVAVLAPVSPCAA